MSAGSLSVFVGGCGLSQLQTARTVPPGAWRTTIGAGFAYNRLIKERENLVLPVSNVPVEIAVRHGINDQVDVGLRTFMGLGALADAKWNLLPVDGRAALAVASGGGVAADPGGTERLAWIAHIPISVIASTELTRLITPYAAIGYRSFWIFNYGPPPEPGSRYAARSWTGDGVVLAQFGVELSTPGGRAFLLEYGYERPVVDDPGDSFSFVPTHLFSVGFRMRSAPGGQASRH